MLRKRRFPAVLFDFLAINHYLCEKMKNIPNTPNGFVSVGLQMIYPELGDKNAIDFLEGLPLYETLLYIIKRQEEVQYSFGDVDAQMNLIYEMYHSLSEKAKAKLRIVIGNNTNLCLVNNMATFYFIMAALQSCNSTVNHALSDVDRKKIYQAYLKSNDQWTDNQAKGILPLAKEGNLIGMYLMADVPIVEFKNYKNFIPQLYKAWRLFNFMASYEPYSDYLNTFLTTQGLKNWQEYISRIFSFYSCAIDKSIIQVEKQDSSLYPFFDKLCVDLGKCKSLWDKKDMTYLRNHPLIKIKEGIYMVTNTNLLTDRIYQCLKFIIFDTMYSTGALNKKKKTFKSLGEFLGMLGEDFSESELFYDIMHKSFDDVADIVIEGKVMKNKGVSAEPDFYMRIGDTAFIFEYKDNTINDDVKFSGDYNTVKEGLLSRVCLDDGRNRKGAGQLLNTINEIVNNHSLDTLDPEVGKIKSFYPIIITTDRTFASLGMQYHLVERFSEIIKKYQISTFIRIPMILDLDTLILMSNKIHDSKINFKQLIDQYLNLDDLKLTPFETFYIDSYKDLRVMNKDDTSLLFGEMFEAIKE